ncbi:MAG: sigma-54-dependent Fis family transcriptional regulator [Acidobacteria bacterium]|nr:sigma-54-dependent Fis family transcriptional regulator [Acidobacteriota bacterium]
MRRVLVIDDDVSTLEMMRFQLESEKFAVSTANNGEIGLELIKEDEFDLILTDLNLPDIDGIEMVRRSKEISPDTEVIMITGHGSSSKAVEATKAGAFYYIEKPVDFEELSILMGKAFERKHQATEIKELRGKLTEVTSYEGIIGGSREMQNIYELIENVADSDASILILGESGTGKEVIANAVHYKSHRKDNPFVKVNCSALPKELIESQLFGHTKGAFTGANKNKDGLIGKAKGGSLMLDEIGEMPVDLQPKLLRVLQEQIYYQVGSDDPREADFRLITATNRHPFEAIADGALREDLYYRINTIEIRIPPLRDRVDDLPMLAEHFLSVYAEKYGSKVEAFSDAAYDQMLNHQWRGNVRELQHVIERAVLLTKNKKIEKLDIGAGAMSVATGAGASDLPGFPARQLPRTNGSAEANGISDLGDLDADDEEKFFEHIGKVIVEKLSKIRDTDDKKDAKDVFGQLENVLVSAALEKTGGNKQAAANLLGLYRPRLYGMIKRHGIEG